MFAMAQQGAGIALGGQGCRLASWVDGLSVRTVMRYMAGRHGVKPRVYFQPRKSTIQETLCWVEYTR
jgi:hypothetical protein